jgi:hypothetical protein
MVLVPGEPAQGRARYHLGVPLWPTSIAAGIALAVLYSVSPLFTLTLAATVVWLCTVGRGLTRDERRQLILVIVVALGARWLLIGGMLVGGIPLHNDLSVGAATGDDGYYLARALRARDIALGLTHSRYDYFVVNDEYGRTSYLYLLTAIQVLFGPTPYGMRALNALIFVAAAVMLFRAVRPAFGATASLTGLVALLFLPSLLVGSISLGKEPLYFLVAAILFSTVLAMLRRWSVVSIAAGGTVAVLCVIALDSLRRGAAALALAGLAIALSAPVLLATWRRAAATLAVLAVAAGAAYSQPPLRGRAIDAVTSVSKTHAGHVFTSGHAYKLLDEGFYFTPGIAPFTLTADQALRFLARAALSFVVTPLPWEIASLRELAFLPEYVAWLALVLFAVPGVAAGWRRDPRLTALLLGFILPTAAAVAVTTGNVGTLLRLRGLVTPFLIWLSALGAIAVAEFMLAPRTRVPFRAEPIA